MLSQTAEYALRAMVYLATQSEPQSVRHVAEQTAIPQDYLAKVLQQLTKAELLTSQRGKGGGFALAVSADELPLLRIVQAAAPGLWTAGLWSGRCPLHEHEDGMGMCPLHARLHEAAEALESTLAATMLAEAARPLPPEAAAGRCSFPHFGIPASGRDGDAAPPRRKK